MTGVSVISIDEKPETPKSCHPVREWITKYFQKWLGQHKSSTTSIPLSECLITFVGTMLGMGIISLVHYQALAKYTSPQQRHR